MKTKIRKCAARKTVVKITARKKAKHGFYFAAPTGTATICGTKKGALQCLFAQWRCSEVKVWTLAPVPAEGGVK